MSAYLKPRGHFDFVVVLGSLGLLAAFSSAIEDFGRDCSVPCRIQGVFVDASGSPSSGAQPLRPIVAKTLD